nr:MAG TPA: hypothetical protein [Caudoviricetes sp.]
MHEAHLRCAEQKTALRGCFSFLCFESLTAALF